MISLKELNPHNYPESESIEKNLVILCDCLNVLRAAYGKPMTVTSGLRSVAQQNTLISEGKSSATHSKHLLGQAADIYDPSGDLYDWCKANTQILEQAQLWCEERMGPWQHFQAVPPASGKRWFFP